MARQRCGTKLEQRAAFPEDKTEVCSHRDFVLLTIVADRLQIEDGERRRLRETTEEKAALRLDILNIEKTDAPDLLADPSTIKRFELDE
jgi:hypothetical protein